MKIEIENMNDTFSDEDLCKAFLLRDVIERKNVRNYNSLDKESKDWLNYCANGRENIAKFMLKKIIERINEEKEIERLDKSCKCSCSEHCKYDSYGCKKRNVNYLFFTFLK